MQTKLVNGKTKRYTFGIPARKLASARSMMVARDRADEATELVRTLRALGIRAATSPREEWRSAWLCLGDVPEQWEARGRAWIAAAKRAVKLAA